jgi:hypothetical protein
MRTPTPTSATGLMPFFAMEHRHPEDQCPAANPQMAPFLLKLLSNASAKQHGIRSEADAVLRA